MICGQVTSHGELCVRPVRHQGPHTGHHIVCGAPGKPSTYWVERVATTSYVLRHTASHGASDSLVGSYSTEADARAAYVQRGGRP